MAGAFRLRIDGPQRLLRLIEWGAHFRSRHLQMPYGDQALFLKVGTFRTRRFRDGAHAESMFSTSA